MKPNKNGNMCCGTARCMDSYSINSMQAIPFIYILKYKRKKHLNTCVMVLCVRFVPSPSSIIMQCAWTINAAVHNNNRINLRAQIYSLCEFSGLEQHTLYNSDHKTPTILRFRLMTENLKQQHHFAKVRHVASSMKRNLIRLNANN